MITDLINFVYIRGLLQNLLLGQNMEATERGGGRQVPNYPFVPTALPAKSIDRITSALPDVRDDKWKSAR